MGRLLRVIERDRMMIHTIEMSYEYQMRQAVSQLLRDWEKTPEDFESPEDLMNFVYRKKTYLGEIVVNNMNEWMSEEEWTEGL